MHRKIFGNLILYARVSTYLRSVSAIVVLQVLEAPEAKCVFLVPCKDVLKVPALMVRAELCLVHWRITRTPFYQHGADIREAYQHDSQRFDAVIGMHSKSLQRDIKPAWQRLLVILVHQKPGELTDVILFIPKIL